MKINIFIDKNREEEIIVYAKEKNKLICEIEELVNNNLAQIIGYNDGEAVCLNINDIYAFIVENNKIYALLENSRYFLKCRLYTLTESLPNNFVKINQSAVVNLNKIKSFDTKVSGTLVVTLQNKFTDYVSRSNIKNIKERFGI